MFGVNEINKICPECGFYGTPKNCTPGTLLVEIGLWCLFLFPGIIYTLWRIGSRYKACPKCEAKMISANSPVGKGLFNQYYRIK